MAFAAITALVSFVSSNTRSTRLILVTLALLFFCSGTLSGSRNFLVTFIVGILLLFHNDMRRNYIRTLIIACVITILFSLVLSLHQPALERFSIYFPFLEKLQTGASINWQDLFFAFQSGEIDTSGRGMLWSHALKRGKNTLFSAYLIKDSTLISLKMILQKPT